MVALPPQDTDAPQPPAQRAASMLRAGKSREEIWQALVDRGVAAARATEIVAAVGSEDGVVCSGCQQVMLRASTTLSAGGEPVCSDCSLRNDVVTWQQRAAETLGPDHAIRRCWRCSKPAMSCVKVNEYRWRGGSRMKTYTIRCSACGHSFTGYGGPMAVGLFLAMTAAAIVVPLVRQPKGGDVVIWIASVVLALFFLYKILVWKLHPEAQ